MVNRNRPPPGRKQREIDFATAIESDDLGRIRSLLKSDPGLVNAGNSHGNTPLGHSLRPGGLATFKLLVELGADIHAKNHGGSTLIESIASPDTRDIYEYVIGLGITPTVMQTAHADDTGRLRAILDTNPSLLGSASGRRGKRPLHYAVLGGAAATAKLLIERGADMEALLPGGESDAFTPLALVTQCGDRDLRVPVARLLVEAGANVDVRAGYFGGTILREAVADKDLALAELLLTAGADPNRPDYAGNTALHTAISRGPIALVELVLRFEPDLGARTRRCETQSGGQTPLDVARRLKRRGMENLLPEYQGSPGE